MGARSVSVFVSDLRLKDNEDGRTYTLLTPLVYLSSRWGGRIIVPDGFITDFASVPRGLWNLLPRVGRSNRAAVVHDYLYQQGGISRRVADAVFREALEVSDVGWRRHLFWVGVRLGGWRPWRRYRATRHRGS